MISSPEFEQALSEYHQAIQNFEYAEPAFVDIAILMLSAAEVKLDLIIHANRRVPIV